MRSLIIGALVAATLVGPALAAEPTLPPQADRLLWCASAFFWLAGSAADAGEPGETELYDGWTAALTGASRELLAAAGFAPARIDAMIDTYAQRVLDQLSGGQPRYDVATCPELVPTTAASPATVPAGGASAD